MTEDKQAENRIAATDEPDQGETEESTEPAHDYDDLYAFDANSGSAPQPGGTAKPIEAQTELLVDSEGAVKAVQGDVTSKAHEARVEGEAAGKSQEEIAKDVKATENATDEATKDSGDDVTGITTGAAYGKNATEAKPTDSKPDEESTSSKAPAKAPAAKK